MVFLSEFMGALLLVEQVTRTGNDVLKCSKELVALTEGRFAAIDDSVYY